jgi:hypothetical protein
MDDTNNVNGYSVWFRGHLPACKDDTPQVSAIEVKGGKEENACVPGIGRAAVPK